jgi:hypothetical protein
VTRSNSTPIIRITSVEEKPSRFVASFRSEFLDATYAVVFAGTITGAVALRRFAKMISHQYGTEVELQIVSFPRGVLAGAARMPLRPLDARPSVALLFLPSRETFATDQLVRARTR